MKQIREIVKAQLKSVPRWAAVVLIVSLCLNVAQGITTASISGEVSDLSSTISSLQADNVELEAENEDLDEKVDSLSERSDSLSRRNGTLSGEKDALQSKYDTLSSQYSELEEAYKIATATPTPSPTPAPTPTPTPTPDSGGVSGGGSMQGIYVGQGTSDWDGNTTSSQTAWLSATGDKYHSIPDCGRMNPNKATKTTVGAAQAAGYEACKKCW